MKALLTTSKHIKKKIVTIAGTRLGSNDYSISNSVIINISTAFIDTQV